MRYSMPAQRKSIFDLDSVHKNRLRSQNRKTFESFYQPSILPQFLQKLNDCNCLKTLNSCPLAIKILNDQRLLQAEKKYQNIKKQIFEKSDMQDTTKKQYNDKTVKLNQQNKILQPHLNNLLLVLDPHRIQPLFQILRHTKCEYMTFWIYAKLCENWPQRQEFKKKVQSIARKEGMDIDFCDESISNRLDELYEMKLANVSQDNYMRVVYKTIKNVEFAYKMASLTLIGGRVRKSNEIIKATIQYD